MADNTKVVPVTTNSNTNNGNVPTASSSNEHSPQTELPVPPTILLLNDDCLYHIFDWLPNLRSEIQAARSCTRFHGLLLRKWQTCHRYDVLELEWLRDLLPEPEDLLYFLHQMRENFNWLIINSGCLSAFLKDLKHMRITTLPGVLGFSYDSEEVDCYPTDNNIKTLTKLVPNLRKLRLTQPIRGCHIANFKQLNELHLYDDQHKDFELQQMYLEEICSNLKHLRVLDIRTYDSISELRLNSCIGNLTNLAVLKLNLATLKPVLANVLQLPRLRKLTVLMDNDFNVSNILNIDTFDHKIYETKEFFQILEAKGSTIVSMAIDAYYMPLDNGWDEDISVLDYNKLEKLVICSWIEPPDSLKRYAKMSNLKMLCCRYWTQLTDDIVLEFIEHCHQLQHLDISYCKALTEALVFKSLEIRKAQHHLQQQQMLGYQTTQPLIIHYVLSGFEDDVDKNLSFWRQQHNYIRLTKDFPPNGERGLSYVERGFEFEFE